MRDMNPKPFNELPIMSDPKQAETREQMAARLDDLATWAGIPDAWPALQAGAAALRAPDPAPSREDREQATCETCAWWYNPGDGERPECTNPDSAIYRMTLAADREDWSEEWGCTLHMPLKLDPTPTEER